MIFPEEIKIFFFSLLYFWPFGRIGPLDVYATPIGRIRHSLLLRELAEVYATSRVHRI